MQIKYKDLKKNLQISQKKKKGCWMDMYVRRCISRNVQTELLVSQTLFRARLY